MSRLFFGRTFRDIIFPDRAESSHAVYARGQPTAQNMPLSRDYEMFGADVTTSVISSEKSSWRQRKTTEKLKSGSLKLRLCSNSK